MAGFFERLVARALQPQAEIQPRLPARFEPVEPRLESLWQPEDGPEEQAEARPASPRAAPVVVPRASPKGEASPPERSPSVERGPSLELPQREEWKSTAAPTDRQSLAAEQLQSQVTGFREAPSTAPVIVPNPQPGPPRGLPQKALTPPVAAPAVTPAPAPSSPDQADRPGAMHLPQPQQSGRVVVQPTILPAASEWRAEATPAQAEVPPEPPRQVNVTIERVEVRAALPAAPLKKARPAAPVMGLDEYLKKRTGGQR